MQVNDDNQESRENRKNENSDEQKKLRDETTAHLNREYMRLYQRSVRHGLESLTFDTDDLLDIYPNIHKSMCNATTNRLMAQLQTLVDDVQQLMRQISACNQLHGIVNR